MTLSTTSADHRPVAIVGIGCRFPGSVSSPQEFWALLLQGRQSISEIPPDRIDTTRYFDPRPATPGRIMSRWGGFLDRIDGFDAAYFAMSPREAARLDPQQRLLLETACEALDDAGQDRAALDGSRTGVFVGQWLSDFEARLFADPEAVDFYMTTGSGRYASSGRLSYLLGLRGPSLTVDTACSSSLVAVHLAAQSIRSGDSELALAGGVNVILQPHITIAYSQSRMMAPDGRCKFGDARGDGYVRSEGAAVLVLKDLACATADGDRIYAVIRGSAVNNDGHSSGSMGTPSQVGQTELLERAYADAGVSPGSIGLVEAHGTGTRAGDPVELAALGLVLSRERAAEDVAFVGSVKTNIGHTEGAAGVAGLIKATLALHHEAIPASLNFEEPNPAVRWNEIPLRVPTELSRWPRGSRPRRASVSAFGIAGTNAHVVLEEAPVRPERTPDSSEASVLLLSAAAPEALTQRVRDVDAFIQRLGETSDATLEDICYTAAARRTHHEYRLAVPFTGRAHLLERLSEFALRETDDACIHGRVGSAAPPRLVFVYPGQGSQWLGMGRDLLRSAPAFREALIRCDDLIRIEAGWSVIDELHADESRSRFGEIDVIQPVLFALQVALTELWRGCGVRPAAVVGHSMGEVAAAWAAGALSLEDGVRVICRRSRLMRSVRGRGAMALVELGFEAAQKELDRFAGRLCIAVSNSARATVVAGELPALDELLNDLGRREVFCRRINVDVASHSPQMDSLLEPLRDALAELAPRTGDLPLYSTVDARPVSGSALDADYWARNLRNTVRFSFVVRQLLAEGPATFIELSPHPVLLPSIQQDMQSVDVDGLTIGSLARDAIGQAAFGEALARAHVRGHSIRWSSWFPQGRRLTDLPAYPWQRERHWYESIGSAERGNRRQGMLRQVVQSSLDAETHLADFLIDAERAPYLKDHRVRGTAIVPAAVFIDLACEAAVAALGSRDFSIQDLRLEAALLFDDVRGRLVQVALAAGPPGVRTLRVSSRAADDADSAWIVHARGLVRPGAGGDARVELPPEPAAENGAGAHYAAMSARGLEYGPAFQALTATLGAGDVLWGRLALPAGLSGGGQAVHPSLIDAALQLGVASIHGGDRYDTVVPVGLEEVRYTRGEQVFGGWARATRRASTGHGATTFVSDIELFRDDGSLLLAIRGLHLQRVGTARAALDSAFFAVDWQPRVPGPGSEQSRTAGTADSAGRGWLIIARDAASARALATPLQALGEVVASSLDSAPIATSTWAGFKAIVHLAAAIGGAATSVQDDPLAASLEACERLLHSIHQVLAGTAQSGPQFVVVTCGAQAFEPKDSVTPSQAPLWGVMRTLANENAELRSRVVDLAVVPTAADFADLAAELVRGADDQVAIRTGRSWLPRLRSNVLPAPGTRSGHSSPRGGRAYRAVAATPGILDGLVCRPLARRPPARGEVEIEIEATGLNFLNVMSALGTCPGHPNGVGPLGLECAGRVAAVGEGVDGYCLGAPVIGVAFDCLASHVTLDARLVRRRPEGLSAVQAATTPLVFATAHHAIVELGRLRRGERVMIHAAAGGVGLAAIQVAHHAGAEVYATAGSPEKRALLESLGVRKVMDSRSLAFRDELLECTAGEGVDVVLNSLAGDFLTASLAVLKPFGRFLEIGKQDIYRNSPLGLLPFSKSLAFFAIDLDRMIREKPDRFAELLDAVLALFASGAYHPLPVTAVPMSQMIDAFRDMAQGLHVGKLALTHDDSALRLEEIGDPLTKLTGGTCLITGGLGGLGIAVAEWLADRGAKRLALVGRSAPGDSQTAAIARLRARGLQIEVFQADVSDASQVSGTMDAAERQLGPLCGVIHAAGVLDDAMLPRQDAARFARVMAPKLGGAWNLHSALESRPDVMLVLFSSVASLLGLAGQANYAAANAGLDALAQFRTARGEPTLAINWGPWSDVGMAAARVDRGRRLESNGLPNLAPAAALEAFGRALASVSAQVAIVDLDVLAYVGANPAARRSTLLAELLSQADGPKPGPAAAMGLKEQLLDAEPGRRRIDMLQAFIREQVGKVLRQPASRLGVDKPFRSLGLDSLMGLELRNRLEAGTALTLPATMVWNYPTISTLAEEIAVRMGVPLRPVASAPSSGTTATASPGDADVDAMLAEIEAMSAEEALNQLSKGD